jgi:hypothetical protein
MMIGMKKRTAVDAYFPSHQRPECDDAVQQQEVSAVARG